MEPKVTLEFTVSEVNYILERISDGSIRAGKALFDRIVEESSKQLKANAQSEEKTESE